MPEHLASRNLGLTKEQQVEVFKQAFGSKYEVYPTALIGADLIIKKSGWTGIAVKFKEKDGRTLIRYNGMSPSAFVRFLMLGLIPLLILYYKSWKPLQEEVGSFIKGAPQLQ